MAGNIRITLLGPQGSGKGTQAKMICEKYNLLHIDLGSELRKVEKEDSDMGRRVKALIDAGDMVPDEISFHIFERLVDKAKESESLNGFVADGFPRTEPQLKEAYQVTSFEAAILIEVTEEESVNRLLKRAEIEHRPDDTEDAIRHRLKLYHEDTEPLITDYSEKGILLRINGEQSIEEVFAEIDEKLAEKISF